MLLSLGSILKWIKNPEKMPTNKWGLSHVVIGFLSPGLLYWGDFFEHIQWPQVAILLLVSLDFIEKGYKWGRKITPTDCRISMVETPVWIFCVVVGGFYG
jgi:hypothetical protein